MGEGRSLEVPTAGLSGSWYLVCAARRHSASAEFSGFAERAWLWQLTTLEQLQGHWAAPATLQDRGVAIWTGQRLARGQQSAVCPLQQTMVSRQRERHAQESPLM